jgi:hypothetical protein
MKMGAIEQRRQYSLESKRSRRQLPILDRKRLHRFATRVIREQHAYGIAVLPNVFTDASVDRLDAELSLDFAPQGFHCRMVLPTAFEKPPYLV